jgi:hypothetical protein
MNTARDRFHPVRFAPHLYNAVGMTAGAPRTSRNFEAKSAVNEIGRLIASQAARGAA